MDVGLFIYYLTPGVHITIVHFYFYFVKYYRKKLISFKKNLIVLKLKLDKTGIRIYTKNMAILPTVDTSSRKRELTEKQQAFLDNLVECQGDAKEAAKLAGYSSHYHHVVKTLKSEILELTQEVLANSAPKAAFKLVEIMESKKPIVQANNKLAAAQTLLDRVGVGKIDKVDINHNVNTGGIFLMPDKAPIELDEGQYEELLD